jgi:hypothetical protein
MDMKCLGVLSVMLMTILSAQGAHADVIGPEIYWILGIGALIVSAVPLSIAILIAIWVIRRCSSTTTEEFKLGHDRTFKIHISLSSQSYRCSFRVKEGNKTLLPKTHFYTTPCSLTAPPQKGFAPAIGRITCDVVNGKKSEIVGVVNAFTPHIIKALYNFKTQEYWTAGGGDTQKGQSLLNHLQADYPETHYVLEKFEDDAGGE